MNRPLRCLAAVAALGIWLLATPTVAVEVSLREALDALDPQRSTLALTLGQDTTRRGPMPTASGGFWAPVLELCRTWGLRPLLGDGRDPAALVVLEPGPLPPHGQSGPVLVLLEGLRRQRARLLSGRQDWLTGRAVVLVDPRLGGNGLRTTLLWLQLADDAGRPLALGRPALPAGSEPSGDENDQMQLPALRHRGRLRFMPGQQPDMHGPEEATPPGGEPLVLSGLLDDSRGLRLQTDVILERVQRAVWQGRIMPGQAQEIALGGTQVLVAMGAAGAVAPRPGLPVLGAHQLLVVDPPVAPDSSAVTESEVDDREPAVQVRRADLEPLRLDHTHDAGVWRERRWQVYRCAPVGPAGVDVVLDYDSNERLPSASGPLVLGDIP
jgi:hypothetical protein